MTVAALPRLRIVDCLPVQAGGDDVLMHAIVAGTATHVNQKLCSIIFKSDTVSDFDALLTGGLQDRTIVL